MNGRSWPARDARRADASDCCLTHSRHASAKGCCGLCSRGSAPQGGRPCPTRSGHLLCAKADTESAGRGQGQSRVAASGRQPSTAERECLTGPARPGLQALFARRLVATPASAPRSLDQSHRDVDQIDHLGGDRTDHQVDYRTQAAGSHDDRVALCFVDMQRNFVGR